MRILNWLKGKYWLWGVLFGLVLVGSIGFTYYFLKQLPSLNVNTDSPPLNLNQDGFSEITDKQEITFLAINQFCKGPFNGVHSLGFNGEYWLVACRDKFLKYDAGKDVFTDLTEKFPKDLNPLLMTWGKDYWLIGGVKWETPDPALYKYDGVDFIDLSDNIKEKYMASPHSIAWNGKYWLIASEGWYGTSPILYKYNGNTFQNLSEKIKPFDFGFLNTITSNDSYWLLGGSPKENAVTKPKFVKFDGENFYDISEKLFDFRSAITDIKWNGEYFLVAGYDGWLGKYEKENFMNLRNKLRDTLLFSTSDESGRALILYKIIPMQNSWVLINSPFSSGFLYLIVLEKDNFTLLKTTQLEASKISSITNVHISSIKIPEVFYPKEFNDFLLAGGSLTGNVGLDDDTAFLLKIPVEFME